MYRRPDVKSLEAAPFGVAIGETVFHLVENSLMRCDSFAFNEGSALLKYPSYLLAAWDLAHSDVPCAVRDDDEISREVRSMSAAEVQQHRISSGDWNHPQRL